MIRTEAALMAQCQMIREFFAEGCTRLQTLVSMGIPVYLWRGSGISADLAMRLDNTDDVNLLPHNTNAIHDNTSNLFDTRRGLF